MVNNSSTRHLRHWVLQSLRLWPYKYMVIIKKKRELWRGVWRVYKGAAVVGRKADELDENKDALLPYWWTGAVNNLHNCIFTSKNYKQMRDRSLTKYQDDIKVLIFIFSVLLDFFLRLLISQIVEKLAAIHSSSDHHS